MILEVCTLTALDFVVNRFYMQLFRNGCNGYGKSLRGLFQFWIAEQQRCWETV